MRALLAPLVLIAAVAACAPVPAPQTTPRSPTQPAPIATATKLASSGPAVPLRSLEQAKGVIARIRPVAVQACRQARQPRCDYAFLVHPKASLPPNAMQTVNRSGQPVVLFTQALLADLQNTDELAFIAAHETAHHIAGHLTQTRNNAVAGAVLGTIVASATGADAQTASRVAEIGAGLGVRAYSKGYELEADAIGVRLSHAAGFDPLRGAQYFARMQANGNALLSTHPPNAQRLYQVQRIAQGL